MKNITMIEKHLYENKNGTVQIEYRVFDRLVFEIKTKSQLTKIEKDWINKNKAVEVFHF